MKSSTKGVGEVRLVVSPDDPGCAYLYLPDHPGAGHARSVRQVRLRGVISAYSGPDLYVDFDEEGRAIGIEVLA